MEVEMLNRSKTIAVAITATFAFVAPQSFAANSSWLEEQLSISDGYSPVNTAAGPQGRPGLVASAASNSSWLEQQLSITDGYSPTAPERGNAYQGASLNFDPNESFVQRGLRITDGTTE
jgi:hypothetical protein